jgi:hypothetical protein
VIVGGDVEPVGEQEHRMHTVQHGCQVAVSEVGHGLLGAVGESRVRIAGEDPYVACLGGEERCDDLRTDVAGGSVIKIMGSGPLFEVGFGVGWNGRSSGGPELRPATTRWAG